jgi:hypothetical protein
VRNITFLNRPLQAILPALLLLCCVAEAYGADSFNPVNQQLTIPALVIGNASYSNVVVTPKVILSIHGGAASGSVDSYAPALNELTIPTVNVGDKTYTNVLITVASLISIGGANWVDAYYPANNQLRVAAVQVGSANYNNAFVNVGHILSVTGGMPSVSEDTYNAATKQLSIPAVQVGDHIYTNALITIARIESVGAASRLIDAPVQGLCYGNRPSATGKDLTTNNNGQFLYDVGDVVLFWIDGSGGGCTGTSSSTPTSVNLGFLTPTGSQSSVLAFAGGLEAAATLTALNVGSAAVMNVSGLVVLPADATNLDKFIKNEGAALPASASGSIDTFFNGVQANTVLASGGAAPKFVTPVATNPVVTTSVLSNSVVGNLLTLFGNLPGQPTSISIPPSGQLKFTMTTSRYTCPLCAAPATVFTGDAASFEYFDGNGHVTRINNPGIDVIANTGLSDETESGTYTINENVLSKSLSGTSASNGATYSLTSAIAANYADAITSLGSSPTPFTYTYTSGPNSGKVFKTGVAVLDSIDLAPLTLSMLPGKTIVTGAAGCPNAQNVLTFVGVGSGPSSVTMSQSCGGLPVTLTPSAIPGLLEGTDTSGYTIYLGLFGSGLIAGAQFVQIQESAGSLGASGHGNPFQWNIGNQIISVN